MTNLDNLHANVAGPEFSRDGLDDSPLIVTYELTRSGDSHSPDCQATLQSRRHADELSADQSRALVDQLADFPRPPALMLSGGDPLERSDLFSLVEYSAHRRLEVAVNLMASPLVTYDALRRLRDAGLARLSIGLDGANATTHDSFCGGEGGHARTWDIMDMVRELRIPLQVETLLTPRNLSQLDDLARQLTTTRIVLWSVRLPVPVGRCTQYARLSPDQYEQAFATLWRHSLVKPFRIKTTDAPHYRRFVLQQLRHRGWKMLTAAAMQRPINRWAALGTGDGHGTMFISHTGAIFPSRYMPVLCGIFPDENLDRVYQTSPTLRVLREPNLLLGKCGMCEYRHVCGGSRARAYALTGELMAQEPDCNYRPISLN